jgi:ABC-type Mn2+/Zn2+ transport system permease subunit
MTDYGRGIKGGLFAGIIYALVYAVAFYLVGPTTTYLSASDWALLGVGLVLSAAIIGIVGSIIIGVVFATYYGSLPTKSSIVKGIIAGLIFWLIFGLGVSLVTGGFFLVESIVQAVFQVFLFGILLGFFWDMFGGKKKKK